MPVINCKRCGKERHLQPSYISRCKTGLNFCGHECKIEWFREHPECYSKKNGPDKITRKLLLLGEMSKLLREGGNRDEIREKYYTELKRL
jgi:hypothetical protein